MKDVTGIFTHGVNGFGGMQKISTKIMYFYILYHQLHALILLSHLCLKPHMLKMPVTHN
jgi:hypothetical protein